MYSSELQSNLRVLISANKTDVALIELSKILSDNPDLGNQVILLRVRWLEGKRQYNMGTISYEDWGRTQSQVNYALLELISSIGRDEHLTKTATTVINNTINDNQLNVIKGDQINFNTQDTFSKAKRILFISANPKSQAVLRFGKEIREIKEALTDQLRENKYDFINEQAVQPDEILRLLRRHQPTILHLSLHNDKKEGLVFEDVYGNEYPISTDIFSSFIELINAKEPVIECIILNSCNSVQHAASVSRFVRCAIGMKDFMPDDASVAYAKGFYEYINEGEGYDEAHQSGVIQLSILAQRLDMGLIMPLPEIPVKFSVKDVPTHG
jgi:hypothetical protein